jgi:hypothetical protein
MTARLSALSAGHAFPPPPKRISCISFCQWLSKPQGHDAAEIIRQIVRQTITILALSIVMSFI